MKLLAIIPFGLFLFFCGTTLACLYVVITPGDLDLRFISFGVMWIQIIGAILTGSGTYAIIRYFPWKFDEPTFRD